MKGSEAVREAEHGLHSKVPGFGDFFRCSRSGLRTWGVGVFIFSNDIPEDQFPDTPIASGRNAIDLTDNEGLFVIGGGDNDSPDILMKFGPVVVDVRWEARGSLSGVDVIALQLNTSTGAWPASPDT